MKRLIIIGTLFAQGLLASAQSPSILVEMEQSIDSAVMMVDIFVQKSQALIFLLATPILLSPSTTKPLIWLPNPNGMKVLLTTK